jgi:hypothetical protein
MPSSNGSGAHIFIPFFFSVIFFTHTHTHAHARAHEYNLTQIQSMWVWPAFRQKQDAYTKIPKAYGKEMQLHDKGKSPKCLSPALHHPHGVPRNVEYQAATETLRVQYRNVTVLYGVTSDLSGLRKVKLSLYRPGKAQGVSRRLRLPQFLETRHMNVARLSALSTGRL